MNKIIIKPHKLNVLQNIVINSLLLGMNVILWIIMVKKKCFFNAFFYLLVALVIIVLIIDFKFFVASMRNILMTEKGCQISVLWYKKLYTWKELQTKRIVMYEYTELKKSYKYCLELCKKKIDPLKVLPNSYCQDLHPFSFVFIYFGEKEKLNFVERNVEERGGSFLYVANEWNFVEQLREWGVELEEITVKISGRK